MIQSPINRVATATRSTQSTTLATPRPREDSDALFGSLRTVNFRLLSQRFSHRSQSQQFGADRVSSTMFGSFQPTPYRLPIDEQTVPTHILPTSPSATTFTDDLPPESPPPSVTRADITALPRVERDDISLPPNPVASVRNPAFGMKIPTRFTTEYRASREDYDLPDDL